MQCSKLKSDVQDKSAMHPSRESRFVGSLVALALGDAFGASHEGGLLERGLWTLICKSDGKFRWTDDTQMTIDVAESLVANGCIDQDDLARRFAASYQWSRGYGAGTARVLRYIRQGTPWQKARNQVYSDGSFGNGGAMRAPVVGLFFSEAQAKELTAAASKVAAATHAHPLAIEGAVLIAHATALSVKSVDSIAIVQTLLEQAQATAYMRKLKVVADWIGRVERPTAFEITKALGNGIAAVDSCITAICIAILHLERSFDELLTAAISVGGDVDTIAAMSCAIWGARRGAADLPQGRLQFLERGDDIAQLGRALEWKSSIVKQDPLSGTSRS